MEKLEVKTVLYQLSPCEELVDFENKHSKLFSFFYFFYWCQWKQFHLHILKFEEFKTEYKLLYRQ